MSDIIIDKYLTKSNNTNNEINKLIKYKDEFLINPYKVLSTLPSNSLLFYFFIVIIIYGLFKNKNIGPNEIFILLVSVIVVYMLSYNNYSSFLKFTFTKNNELNFLNNIMYNGQKVIKGDILNFGDNNGLYQKKSYLYYDPLISSLMYNIKEYTQENIQSYSNCLRNINSLLKLSFESKNISHSFLENFQSVIIEKNKALNELSSMIYLIPTSTITYEKFNKSIKVLHELLNVHIYKMSKLFIDKTSIDEKSYGYIPADFFQIDEYILPNDLKTINYQSSYNLY